MKEVKKDGPKKIICPVCKVNFCYEDDYPNGSTGYLCYNCGYTSNSNLVSGSEYLEQAFVGTPEIIKDKKFYDKDRNIYWLMSTVRVATGMIFPDPDDSLEGWGWTVAKVVSIPEEERQHYPVPGKDGVFYDSRLATEDAIKFHKNKFYDACQELGGILKKHQED